MAEGHGRVPELVDVAVIGAGPAGSSTAAALAQAGRSVLVLERREFPRFHIGESMLPYTMANLERMKLLDKVNSQGYVTKRGAEFIFPEGGYRRIDFRDQGPGRHPSAVQVERSHFDNVLAEHAKDSGATVLTEANVTELLLDGDRVTGLRYELDGEQRIVHATYVVDAAGRSSKIAQAFRLRHTIERLRMVAVFRHFYGLDEKYNPGYEGDIQIGGHDDGWIWAIPIWRDVISVGAVMPLSVLRASSPEEVFAEHLARVPRISERLGGTTSNTAIRVETDYCYYSDTITGPGWFLVGDSACFFDPIFSGGVLLATTTGLAAAGRIDEILSHPERAEDLQREYANMYKTGYDTYARIIYAYYESKFNLGSYLKSLGGDVEGVPFVRMLSGDFWTAENRLAALLRANTSWDTFAPFERAYGCPVYPHLDADGG